MRHVSLEADANLADESVANKTVHNTAGFHYYCGNGRTPCFVIKLNPIKIIV